MEKVIRRKDGVVQRYHYSSQCKKQAPKMVVWQLNRIGDNKNLETDLYKPFNKTDIKFSRWLIWARPDLYFYWAIFDYVTEDIAAKYMAFNKKINLKLILPKKDYKDFINSGLFVFDGKTFYVYRVHLYAHIIHQLHRRFMKEYGITNSPFTKKQWDQYLQFQYNLLKKSRGNSKAYYNGKLISRDLWKFVFDGKAEVSTWINGIYVSG